jgi:hypothetical protein
VVLAASRATEDWHRPDRPPRLEKTMGWTRERLAARIGRTQIRQWQENL